jgi:hypothetical protein
LYDDVATMTLEDILETVEEDSVSEMDLQAMMEEEASLVQLQQPLNDCLVVQSTGILHEDLMLPKPDGKD